MKPVQGPWRARLLLLASCAMLGFGGAGAVTDDEVDGFDDMPRAEDLAYPDWFNEPFLDLEADHANAIAAGKDLVVYFGQKRCA